MSVIDLTRKVSCKCKTCGETFQIDIGNSTREEIDKWLDKSGGFQCPGRHVELGKRSHHWTIDWNSLHEDTKQSDEDWLKELMTEHGVVYENDELSAYFKVTGFTMGFCMAKDKTSGEEVCLSYAHAPESGKRYYFK